VTKTRVSYRPFAGLGYAMLLAAAVALYALAATAQTDQKQQTESKASVPQIPEAHFIIFT